MPGLIWIQTVWHSDSAPERIYCKKINFELYQQTKQIMKKIINDDSHDLSNLIFHKSEEKCHKFCWRIKSKLYDGIIIFII